jgi:glycosyltransferase involved in cell wall biosynthesis
MPDAQPWPRVTIVTPSYNQGQYLEETIRSVLLQGYPNLQYIIMDGGSKDNSVEVIRKYERWIDHWQSAPDKGQADAINKGLALADGEIFQFINSDDVLTSGTVLAVATRMNDHDAVAGAVDVFDGEQTLYIAYPRGIEARLMLNVARHAPHCTYHQPGVWMRRAHLGELGGFDQRYRYCFDSHLFIRYAERWPRIAYTDQVFVRFRIHAASKSSAESSRFGDEIVTLRLDLAQNLQSPALRAYAQRSAERFAWRNRFEEQLAQSSTRTPASLVRSLPALLLRPDLTWDSEGRRLVGIAFDRMLNAAHVRLTRRAGRR